MSHWLILLGFLTLAVRLAIGVHDYKPAENSRKVACSNEKVQICGVGRIVAKINEICGTTYTPHYRMRREVIPRRQIRQVVEICCRRECDTCELQRYCSAPTRRQEQQPSMPLLQDIQNFDEVLLRKSLENVASRFPAKPLVPIREELPEVPFDESEEEMNSSDNVRMMRHAQRKVYSDESRQTAHHSTSGHFVSPVYTSRPTLDAGMEKLP